MRALGQLPAEVLLHHLALAIVVVIVGRYPIDFVGYGFKRRVSDTVAVLVFFDLVGIDEQLRLTEVQNFIVGQVHDPGVMGHVRH